jgi:hypothetical protein
MTSMHFYGWKNGLKTGQYYLRSRPARDAIKFTVNIESLLQTSDEKNVQQLSRCLSMDNGKAYDDMEGSGKKRPQSFDGEKNVLDRVKRSPYAFSTSSSDEGGFRRDKAVEEEEEVTFECLNCSG